MLVSHSIASCSNRPAVAISIRLTVQLPPIKFLVFFARASSISGIQVVEIVELQVRLGEGRGLADAVLVEDEFLLAEVGDARRVAERNPAALRLGFGVGHAGE